MTKMFDNQFDPLAKLEQLEKNQMEIARAFNSHSEAMNQLVHQNRELNNLLRTARQDIAQLKADIAYLKSQPPREIQYNTNFGNH